MVQFSYAEQDFAQTIWEMSCKGSTPGPAHLATLMENRPIHLFPKSSPRVLRFFFQEPASRGTFDNVVVNNVEDELQKR